MKVMKLTHDELVEMAELLRDGIFYRQLQRQKQTDREKFLLDYAGALANHATRFTPKLLERLGLRF